MMRTYHLGKTTGGDNVTGMNKTVEMTGGLFDLLTQIIIGIEVEDISHQVQRILIVRDLGIQTSQVETVCQVILVDLAEVLVASG
jgi:hypothetical protein